MKRLVGVGLLCGLLLWSGIVPAGEPEVPLQFIAADVLKALIAKPEKVDLIDVRTWTESVKRRIKG
ncbi:MAG: hypothetical protein HY726_13120, partial [Candidatus Rokubacteria bacterium]|nr:hypothetical protein [Candidatus Rokubacteria bacterium]